MGECLIIRGGGGTDTSNATATASVVLSGYTCYVNDQLIAGSMPVQTLNQKLGAGGSVTIPAGYYDGSSSIISTSTLAGETAANAASSHILSGYNAWVNGTNTWGNMPNRGNISHSLPANGTYTVPAGWHAGGGVVNQSLAFHWGGTYTPNTANQVICWANWYAAGNIVVLGSSALVSSNIRKGVRIFGVLGNFTGWVDSTMPMSAAFTVVDQPDYNWNWSDTKSGGSDIRKYLYYVGVNADSPIDSNVQMVQNLYNNCGFRWLNYEFRYEIDTGNNRYGVGVGPFMYGYTSRDGGAFEFDSFMNTYWTFYNDEDGWSITQSNRRLLYEVSGKWIYCRCGMGAYIVLSNEFAHKRGIRMTYCNVWLSKE